jgi:tetratricopeptide (TPR) repeat protein
MQPHEPTFGFDAFDLADRILNERPAEAVRPDDFGPYHFPSDEPLGTGALGAVWLAEERGELGAERNVAVKILRNVSRPDLAANEVKSQAKLEHQYIARLYNHGVLADGTPWLAMELVDGKPLDQYCNDLNCSVDQRLRLFHAVCEAVRYAHVEKDIDHGDLKPSNILIRADGEPKLLDFGLARRLSSSMDPSSQAPVLGFTPAYAAPEQFRGRSARFRSDVYSLGVILYELLSGELPIDASKHTLAEVETFKSAREKPEPPSAVAKRRALYPANRSPSQAEWHDLDALCLKATESDINLRYSSVEALLADLDRFFRIEPLAARSPQTRGYRAGKFLRRHRSAAIAASLVFLLIAGLVTAFTYRLAKERDKALAEATRTRRIQRFTVDLLGNADQQAAPSKGLTVLEMLDRGAATVASLNSDPETQAELYLTLGRMYEELNQLPKADQLLRLAVEKARAIGNANTRTSNALVQLGLLRADQAQYAEAERLIREALDILARLRVAPGDPVRVSSESALGKVLVQAGAYDKAIALLAPIVQRPAKDDDSMVNLLESLTALAVAEQYSGKYADAVSHNQRALELDRKLHGNNHPRVATDLANIGTTEATWGHFAEAEDLYRQSADIFEATYGPRNPQTVQVKSFVGLMAMQAGRSDEAEKLLQDVLPLLEESFGTSMHPNVAFIHDALGKLASARQDLPTAEKEFGQSLKINAQLYGEKDYRTAMGASNLAQVLVREHQYGPAERIAVQAVKALTDHPLPGNMNVGVAELNLGEALLGQKRYQEALKPLSDAQDLFKTGPPTIAPRLEDSRRDLLRVYEALNLPDKAASLRAEIGKSH